MNSLLFPGQGSQVVGMGDEFYKNFKSVKKIFELADERLNYKISKIILEGPEDKLKLTEITQPAILIVSYSIFKVMKDEFGYNFDNFNYFAGHSLGEYSALVASEALQVQDALYLLSERGKAMQESVPLGKGSMIAVLGISIEEINYILDTLNNENNVCEVANDNAIGQIIISGDKKTIDKLIAVLKEKKIKIIPLKVSAPFHCSLMKPAAENMKSKINSIELKKPKKKIVSNVTSVPETDPIKIKELLIKQIYSTVRWRESLINLNNENVKNFVELGPGKVLTGMVKRTIKESNCFSINSINDIENFINEFKK